MIGPSTARLCTNRIASRLLAPNIDVPQDPVLKMVRAETLEGETLALLSSGMENLVSALAEVTGLTDDLQDESRH
jgi:hypothetical protein